MIFCNTHLWLSGHMLSKHYEDREKVNNNVSKGVLFIYFRDTYSVYDFVGTSLFLGIRLFCGML